MNIEKNIPIPERTHGGGKGYGKYAKMEIGDSIFFEGKGSGTAHAIVGYTAKAHGFKFLARKEGSGCRVWRIS